jgi:hypothetical protein
MGTGDGDPGQPHRGAGRGRGHPRLGRAADAAHRPARPHPDAGLRRRARAPHARRPGPDPVRAPRRARDRRVPLDHQGPRRDTPRHRVDHRWRLVPRGLPRRRAAARGPRPGGAGPARVPAQPRRPRRLGQLPGPGARRDRRRHAGPCARPDRPRRGREPVGHAARGRDGPRGGAGPAGDARRPPACDPREPALSPLAGDHQLAGRVGDAGGTASRASSRSRSWWSGAPADTRVASTRRA